jgi:hypothetical protein
VTSLPRFMSCRHLAFAAFAWLAIPAVALADDCSAWTLGEVPSCLLLGALLPPFLVAAAILAIANWLQEPPLPLPPPLPPLDARPVTPTNDLPDIPPSYPPGYMYDPKTGELWFPDSNRPYPTDPHTGEPLHGP